MVLLWTLELKNKNMSLKSMLMKKMLKSQMKGVPEDQVDKLLQVAEI